MYIFLYQMVQLGINYSLIWSVFTVQFPTVRNLLCMGNGWWRKRKFRAWQSWTQEMMSRNTTGGLHTSARRSSFHLPKWIYIFDIFKACAIVYISCMKKDITEHCSNFLCGKQMKPYVLQSKGPPLPNANVNAPAGLAQVWRSAGNSDPTAIRLYTRLKWYNK